MIARLINRLCEVTRVFRAASVMQLVLSACLGGVGIVQFDVSPAYAQTSSQSAVGGIGGASNQVVAEVGGHRITRAELDNELRRHVNNQLDSYSPEEQHLLRQRMLEMMIKRALLIDAARRSGVMPGKAEVAKVLQHFRQEAGGEAELSRELARRNLDGGEFESGLREDLAINAYLEKTVFSLVSVSEEEARRFFEKNPDKFTTPAEVKARHILFRLSEDADPAERERVQLLAERVLSLLRGPNGDFAALAERFSDAPNGAKGGELDFFTRNQMDPEFSDAAFALKPGEISDIVTTRHGLHIIKVEERRGGEKTEFGDVENEVRQWISQEKQDLMLSRHLSQLREENKVIVYYR